jgi:hypothetical protein
MVLIAYKGVYTDVQHITKCFRFFSVFISIDQRTALTAGAILMVNGSKDVVWRKDVPFGDQNNIVEGLGGQIPQNTIFWPQWGIPIIKSRKDKLL